MHIPAIWHAQLHWFSFCINKLPCLKSNSKFLTLDNLLIINEDKHATSQYSSTTFHIIIYPKQSTAWHLLPPYQYYSVFPKELLQIQVLLLETFLMYIKLLYIFQCPLNSLSTIKKPMSAGLWFFRMDELMEGSYFINAMRTALVGLHGFFALIWIFRWGK